MRTHLGAARVAGLLLMAALPLGCAHHASAPNPPAVVGTWSGTVSSGQSVAAQTTFTFTADGRETMAAQINSGPTHMSLSSTGTYTIRGTGLTQTLVTVTENGITKTLPSNGSNVETDQFTLNGDTLTLTKPGSPTPLVLTRQKS